MAQWDNNANAYGRPAYPRLRVCFTALAGLGPLHGERLAARGGASPLARGVIDRDMFAETSSYGGRTIDSVLRVLGVDMLVFGSDRPYAQPCCDPVDGQMNCLYHALVGIAGPVTLQQFDLYMVERIEVGKSVLARAREQGILVEQCLLARDGEQHFNRRLPFGTQPRKDSFAQLGVLDELRVT